MDVFGAQWANHFEKISEDWRARVNDDDIVLLPGDLTWAMRLEEAMEDIRRVGELPGKKLILRGNHDYWWSAIGPRSARTAENMFAIQNDAMLIDGVLFAGTRGWMIPSAESDPNDVHIYNRERLRLEMSLKTARRLSPDAPLVAMLHYPPLFESALGFSDILNAYGVSDCVYGHLHGASIAGAVRGVPGRRALSSGLVRWAWI